MSKIKTIDKDVLYQLYIEKDMTLSQVRKELSSSDRVVSRELNKYGLVKLKREMKRTIKDKRLYRIWQGMKTRCYNENDHSYKHYGKNGIGICYEWKESFNNFYEWSIENGYNDKFTIDRIDYNGNYEPNNCRWVDYDTQNNNKCDNLSLYYEGKSITINEIAEMTGLNKSTVRNRLASNWSVEKIIATPRLDYNQSTITNKRSSRVIQQFSITGDYIRTFQSLKEASEQLGVSYHSISDCLRGKLKTAGGYVWRYAESHLN